jgi:hypothetical protein
VGADDQDDQLFRMRVGETTDVPADSLPTVLDLSEEDLKARFPQRKKGEHSWVIGMVFTIDDPEQALDSMELGADNVMALVPIYCVFCQQQHRHLAPLGPDAMCPGVPKHPEPRAVLGTGTGKSNSYAGVRSLDPQPLGHPLGRSADPRRRPAR